MNWSKVIKELRNKLLLTQTEMGQLLGVSFATINRWENEHYEPTIKVKRKIKDLCEKNKIDIESYLHTFEEKVGGNENEK